MGQFRDDLAFALRQLRRSPAFALFIIATLGLGIGANTTIFGAVNAFLLRPLPYAEAERLITLSGAYKNRGDDWSVSLPNALDWGKRNHSLDGLGYYQGGNVTLAGSERPERIESKRSCAMSSASAAWPEVCSTMCSHAARCRSLLRRSCCSRLPQQPCLYRRGGPCGWIR